MKKVSSFITNLLKNFICCALSFFINTICLLSEIHHPWFGLPRCFLTSHIAQAKRLASSYFLITVLILGFHNFTGCCAFILINSCRNDTMWLVTYYWRIILTFIHDQITTHAMNTIVMTIKYIGLLYLYLIIREEELF